jgi:hypothetical protein
LLSSNDLKLNCLSELVNREDVTIEIEEDADAANDLTGNQGMKRAVNVAENEGPARKRGRGGLRLIANVCLSLVSLNIRLINPGC